MELNLEYLRIFFTIAKHKSISQAAEELQLSQPSVTRALQRLEKQVGFPLFIRHSRGVILTQKGDHLLRQFQPSIHTLLNAEAEAEKLQNHGGSIIRVSYSSHATQAVLSDYLQEFLSDHPDFVIDSCVSGCSLIGTLLDQGIADISFGQRPATSSAEHHSADTSESPQTSDTLEGYSLGIFEDIFFVGPPLAHLTEKPLNLNDLATYPLLFQRKYEHAEQNEYSTRIEQTDAARAQNLCVEDTATLLRLIQHEPCIAVLSSLTKVPFDSFPQLTRLQVGEPLPKFEYLLHFSKQSPPCFAAATLISYLRSNAHFDCKPFECDCVS